MTQPKIKVRISKTRIDAAMKNPEMQKAKGEIIEKKIRISGTIQKK